MATSGTSLPLDIPPDDIRAELARILGNRRFAGSARHSRLLRYTVEETLAGRGAQIREYTLAVTLFDRGEDFDPQADPIVRTELSRLRAKLREYYASDGAADPLVIEFPRRSYVPEFQRREAPAAAPSEEPQKPTAVRVRRVWILAAGVVAVLLIGIPSLRFVMAREAGAPPRRTARTVGSVVVLPFATPAGDTESERFSEGLTDELIHEMSRIDGLRVVSRTSAYQYRGKSVDVRTVAAQLNVDAVLEGTVRRAGNTVRVSANLVDAVNGLQIRSDRYEREMKDTFAVQEDISRHVANALRARRAGGHGELAVDAWRADSDVYTAYLEALTDANRGSEMELRHALDRLERLLAGEPRYAPAHAATAEAYVQLAAMSAEPPMAARSQAKASAERAVALAPALAESRAALALERAAFEWDWAGAEAEFHRALELDPGDAGTRELFATFCLLPQGRTAEALAVLERARGIDDSPVIAFSLAAACRFARRPQEASERSRALAAAVTDSPGARIALAAAYADRRMHAEALQMLDEARSLPDNPMRAALAGFALGRSGDSGRARRALEDLRELGHSRPVSGLHYALVFAGLGERAEAVRQLERAAEEHFPPVAYLKVDPLWDDLRGEPTFQRLVKRLGL